MDIDTKLNPEKEKKPVIKESKDSGFEKEEPAEKIIEGEKEVEVSVEKPEEKEKPKVKEEEFVSEPSITPSITPSISPPLSGKTALRKEIEIILEEDLEKVYDNMDEKQKVSFKKEGEKTASRIESLVNAIKVKTNQILNLIKKWLKLIPGVNKFFLEQEAKIKTDKILNLKDKGKI